MCVNRKSELKGQCAIFTHQCFIVKLFVIPQCINETVADIIVIAKTYPSGNITVSVNYNLISHKPFGMLAGPKVLKRLQYVAQRASKAVNGTAFSHMLSGFCSTRNCSPETE